MFHLRTNLEVYFLRTPHSMQPVNFSFVTRLKHYPVYSGRRSGCRVYPSTGHAQYASTPGRATGSDRKGSWRIWL